MTYDEFKQNFLPEFLEITTYSGRMRYVKEHLTGLGRGSGRIVYDIDGEKVLKLAMNPKGVAQNEVENQIGDDPLNNSIVTEVFESDDQGSWIIAEKGLEVTERRICELTGIPSLTTLHQYLRYTDPNDQYSSLYKPSQELIDFFNDNEFALNLKDFVATFDQKPSDMGRPSTYGEVLRNGRPSIVLTDYGLNEGVVKNHYSESNIREMYNHADGNDDMLSDIGNTEEARFGMWAYSPETVSEDLGVINEKFIKFVSENSKYPKNEIKGLPQLTDHFHDCANNLTEVLKIVEDKNQFLNNLYELQEYIVRRGFFHGGALVKEDGSAKFSSSNSMNQDDFPAYNTDDTSPMIQNDLNANSAMYNEDLEYKHVDGDATDDEYMIGEEIDASEAHSDDGSIRSVLDGSRDIGFVSLFDEEINKLDGFEYLVLEPNPFRGFKNYVFYKQPHAKEKANTLYSIAQKHSGYLKDESPDEARAIGELLSYSDESINDYVNKKYKMISTRTQRSVSEADKSYGAGSKAVEVKKKCQLGGNGDGTSTACNQGDISNLKFKSLEEEISLDSGFVEGWNNYSIMNDGVEVGEMEVSNKKFIVLNKVMIHPDHRGQGYADEVLSLLINFANNNKKIIALTPDNVWGVSVPKLKKWYKSLGFVLNTGRNKDYQVRELMIKQPNNLGIKENSGNIASMNDISTNISDARKMI